MKKILLLFGVAFVLNAQSQTNTFPTTGSAGIGTLAPNASAILDIVSTNKGVLLPRMTVAQRNLIASPATGLLIYQTNSTPGVYYFNGIAWAQISAGKASTNLNNLSAVTAVSQSLLPGTTNSIDLGSGAKTWKDLYLSGNANVVGTTTLGGNLIFNNTATNNIQFATSVAGGNGMITMFPNGTQNPDRMVIQHSSTYPNWGLQYQDTMDVFNFVSGGTPVLTANLGYQRVGVFSKTPGARFDIGGSGTYDLTGAANYADFRLGDNSYNLKMGVSNAGGGAGDVYIAGSGRLYLGTSNTFTRSQTVAINQDGTVGVGSFVANAKLGVTGDTISSQPVISATATYTGGNSDVRGVSSSSVIAPGYGYGVYATGGYMGVFGSATSSTYTGTGYGVYGNSSGSTAGVRIGVYGSASGALTTEANWGGYFPTKTYTSELRVGGTKGATGYVAAINGKLIATEVRVDVLANWPDYVFDNDYKLIPLDELEAKLNTDKHLPGIPSAVDVKKDGIMLGEMQTKTIEKVEENTLYILQLNNRLKAQEESINTLKEQNAKLTAAIQSLIEKGGK